MPRDIPLGNGRLLVNFDGCYHIRDIYYPRVGGENHSAGHPFRFGVWCEGQFGWIHDDDWSRSLNYEDDTLVTSVALASDRLGMALHCRDAVDFHETVFVRRIRVQNRADHAREVRLFLSHDFHISDFEVGDTAAYHPHINAILHYKGPRYFLINACTPTGGGITDYATGIKESEGREGTWRDAEDGVLGKNPIAQGAVDSTIGIALAVEAGASAEVYYWICAGESYQEVTLLNDVVVDKGPATLLDRTAAYWSLWTNKDELDFDDLPESVVRLYKRSLLVVRTQIDSGGAIIAANDTDNQQFNRDTYSYMWPRDGAIIAHGLDVAGFETLAADFYRFCKPLLTKEGYFLHKYNPDGSAGSSWHPWVQNGEPQLPIQEDETALVVWALWKHFDKFRDVETIKPLYRDLIIEAGSFLARYIDHDTRLPKPSYDLWEERRGIHAWTCGAVYGGLVAASNFAHAFGEEKECNRFHEAARTIRTGVERHLWSEEAQRFLRTIYVREDGSTEIDSKLDASILGLFLFGMYAADDPKIESTFQALYDRLWVKTPVGGMARYEDDYYHRVSDDTARVPGNPWFVCTLWLAQYYIARARSEAELGNAVPIMEWAADHALTSGILAEQVDPFSHAPLSVSPLTWSHSNLVTTVIEYLDRKSDLTICSGCAHPVFLKEHAKLRLDRAHKEIHRRLRR